MKFGEISITTIHVGLSNLSDAYRCGQDAARLALSRAKQPVSLAILFSSHPQPQEVLRGVNAILPGVPLIGTTSLGEYTPDGYVEQGAGIMLIHSDTLELHPVARRWRWSNNRLLGKLRGISKDGLGHFTHRTLMIFPDNHSMNLDKLVQKAISETAMLYDIVGGAGLATPTQTPAIFFNEKLLPIGLAGTEMLSHHPIGLALANGWTPVSGPYRVTKADEYRVIKIDGRPVREVYEDFFREHGHLIDEIERLLPSFPIGVCGEGDCKVSLAMQGFEPNGALSVTSPPPKGSLVYILKTQPDMMITAAQRAIRHALDQLAQTPPAGALFIDCMSTSLILGDSYQQQRAAVQNQLGEVPFLGFRSHGVLARLSGQTNGHYECSVATCILPA